MKQRMIHLFSNKTALISLAAGILLVIAAILIFSAPRSSAQEALPTSTPTDEAPNELTLRYGHEVAGIIEGFEVSAHTVKMYTNEDNHAKMYTGPYLDYIDGYYMSFDDTTLWPIVAQATVTKVRVVEYSDEKIRVLACVTEQKIDLNSKGDLVDQEKVNVINGAYVFIKENGIWKVGSFLDMAHPESAKLEYAMMDDDLKEITGDFKSLSGLYCSGE